MKYRPMPVDIFDEVRAELPHMACSRECLFQCWSNTYNIVYFLHDVKSPNELNEATKTTELVYWTVELLKICNDENTP